MPSRARPRKAAVLAVPGSRGLAAAGVPAG
jgi:hypothetical protein